MRVVAGENSSSSHSRALSPCYLEWGHRIGQGGAGNRPSQSPSCPVPAAAHHPASRAARWPARLYLVISRSAPGRAPGNLRRTGLAAVAGMIGSVLFVSVFTIGGWLTPGYSPTGMFVSELSLGPGGWVQILNFVLTGALMLLFGVGLATHFSNGAASRAGPALIQGIGVSLMASGPFTTDPSAMFDQHSVHGTVHGIFGALVFTFAPISCFVFFRRFRRDPGWRPLARWTLASGVILTLGIGLLRISQVPGGGLFEWKGLVQRIILVTFMAWIFAVAFRLRRHSGRAGSGSQD